MKKIGTITTNYALNFGAVLQSYALATYLNNAGYKCEVVDYRPDIAKFGRHYYRSIHRWQDLVINIFAFFNIKEKKNFKTKVRLFDEFLTLLPLSEKQYIHDDDFKCMDEYDVLIVGSDQIWNLDLMDMAPFFLQFDKGKRRHCAYAASVASPLNPEKWKIIGERTQNFDELSFREEESRELFKTYTGRECSSAIDPVFLLDMGDWRNLAEQSSCHIKEPYVLCYFLGNIGYENDVANKIQKKYGYKVVNIGRDAMNRIRSDYNLSGVSPADFIKLIMNAEYVLTNSFHMTSFAIIFGKEFLVIAPQSGRNIRMENILCKAELLSKIVYTKEDALLAVENSTPNHGLSTLNNYILYSKQYLEKEING